MSERDIVNTVQDILRLWIGKSKAKALLDADNAYLAHRKTTLSKSSL